VAQTWPVSRTRLAVLKAADRAGRVAFAPLRAVSRRSAAARSISRILVIEPWHIGDVVLVTPFLRALRASQPSARITILARKHAEALLEHSGLVDEVVVATLPWTNESNKYPLNGKQWRRLASLVDSLRRKKFDLTVDARMDIRSNLLAAAIGAPLRVGYDIGGGGWLLTNALRSERDETHRLQDWADLLALIPGSEGFVELGAGPPSLVVSKDERSRAATTLNDALGNASPTIGYHPGGSHLGKRWPAERFAQLTANLQDSVGGRHVLFLGPDEQDVGGWPRGVVVLRPTLRELMAFTACCDVFVCNDSGPMHIADGLGIPVVAIFEVGNPKWFGPSGPRATVIEGQNAGKGLSAAPLDAPPLNPVSVTCVADAVRRTLQTQA
jgi:ADP-heptose:LPS heptosyltransferase